MLNVKITFIFSFNIIWKIYSIKFYVTISSSNNFDSYYRILPRKRKI